MTAEFLSAIQEECGGCIPFDRFMAAALYHPDFGYYTKNIRTVGARGDFSTWPSLDGSLALGIAGWLAEQPGRHVIEVGAGTGRLAADVLRGLGWRRRWRTTLHIVEVSPVLRAQQLRTLRGQRVCWHATMAEALQACGGVADIYSNELPDAFPCRVFVRAGDSWSELAIRVEGGSAHETLRPVPNADGSSHFSDAAHTGQNRFLSKTQGGADACPGLEDEAPVGLDAAAIRTSSLPCSSSLEGSPPEGSRVEVHESYRSWLQSWASGWTSGRMLTVDYGDEMPALYRRRPGGSIRAYAHQQRLTGKEITSGFGKRDITADVNFSDLRAWGEGLGWKTISSARLAEWMQSVPLSPALREAGEAFRILVQRA